MPPVWSQGRAAGASPAAGTPHSAAQVGKVTCATLRLLCARGYDGLCPLSSAARLDHAARGSALARAALMWKHAGVCLASFLVLPVESCANCRTNYDGCLRTQAAVFGANANEAVANTPNPTHHHHTYRRPPPASHPHTHPLPTRPPPTRPPPARPPPARPPPAHPPPSSNRNRTDRQLGTTLTPHHYVPKQKNVRFLFFETRVLPSERNKALRTRDGCYRNRLAWHWFKAICTISWTKLTVEVTVCAVYSLVLT